MIEIKKIFLGTIFLTAFLGASHGDASGFNTYTYTLASFRKDIGANTGNNQEDFSGLAFNPSTQRLMIPDLLDDVIMETDLSGLRTRTLGLSSFKEATELLTPTAITWVQGNTYAFILSWK